jgi:ectoine hydroxylase-related dioxygenase (phytanoyl-CoA dioxygenase family)
MNDLAKRFADIGYAFPFSVLTPAEAARAAAEYPRFQARARAVFGEEQRFKAHLLVGWLDALVHDPRLLDPVSAILGPDLLLWSSDFFVKQARDPGYVSFHQDTTYAGLEPFDGIVNCWVALTPSRKANGCLQVVPGSHKLGQLAHVNTHAADNMLFFGQTAELDVDAAAVVDLELDPGEMSLHHMAIVHGSQPNASDTPRMGVVLRFIAPWVRQTKGPDSATLVRGADSFGHFEHEPRPDADWSEAAVAAFSAAIHRPSALG